jgi:hypothetical protein
MRYYAPRTCVLIATAYVLAACPARATELSKQDAGIILSFMACNPRNVVAVINGAGAIGMAASSSGNVATVIAACNVNGKPETKVLPLFYDSDLGWFYFEENKETGVVRLWTKTGFRQVGPLLPPARQ